jgi:hypothetical protein
MASPSSPWFTAGRPRRSGVARRLQATRAQARAIGHLLSSVEALCGHRGCTPTRLTRALAEALAQRDAARDATWDHDVASMAPEATCRAGAAPDAQRKRKYDEEAEENGAVDQPMQVDETSQACWNRHADVFRPTVAAVVAEAESSLATPSSLATQVTAAVFPLAAVNVVALDAEQVSSVVAPALTHAASEANFLEGALLFGDSVEVYGLQSAQVHGRRGCIVRFVSETSRFEVLLDGGEATKGVKAANLRRIGIGTRSDGGAVDEPARSSYQDLFPHWGSGHSEYARHLDELGRSLAAADFTDKPQQRRKLGKKPVKMK